MKLTKLSLAIVGSTCLVAGAAQAAGPTLSDVLGNSGITESGYIDAAYTYLDSKDTLNAFDGNYGSTFNIKQAALQLAKQPASGFGGLVNITMGSDADIIKSYPYAAVPGGGSGFDLTQAFAQYTTGALTLQAGKYTTLASAEVIAPNGNTNITRSIEFFQVPFTHTGVRATYAPSSTVTLYGGLNNGWDEQSAETIDKTAELGLAWSPTASFSWALQGYYGPQPAVDQLTGATLKGSDRSLIDTVLTWKTTSALTLILNADYGQQTKASVTSPGGDANWSAVVGYINYQWTDKWRTSFRIENFDDSDGYKLGLTNLDPSSSTYGMPVKSVSEATLTVGYAPDPSFELRGEVRDDKAEKDAYTKFSGETPTDTSLTLAVEGLYKF